MVETLIDWLQSVVDQAEDRDSNTVRTIDAYFETRRQNIGCRPTFVIGEFNLSIPKEDLSHPTITKLEILAADMTLIVNVSLGGVLSLHPLRV
jgi:hypothetical protein